MYIYPLIEHHKGLRRAHYILLTFCFLPNRHLFYHPVPQCPRTRIGPWPLGPDDVSTVTLPESIVRHRARWIQELTPYRSTF